MGRGPTSSQVALFLSLSLVLFIFPLAASASGPPSVNLTSPNDGQIFTATDNVTFVCNATDDEQLKNISLYHDIGGSFVFNKSRHIGEFELDSNALLLCHFNDDFTCAEGEVNVNYGYDPTFGPAKFYNGTFVDGSDILVYSGSENFDENQGTIELWLKPGTAPVDMTDRYVIGAGTQSGFDLTANNRFTIYINNGVIYFYIADHDSTNHHVSRDITGWQVGQLYHIAAVWDLDGTVGAPNPDQNSRMDLYLNGTNANNTYTSTGSDIQIGTSPDVVTVGTRGAFYQANSTIDELRISDIVRLPADINYSYNSQLTGLTNQSWEINRTPDGTYTWNCLAYDNESQSDWADSNYTFSIDTETAPTTDWILLSPNSSDDVDPEVSINVTANVSDVSGVSLVIFQWREVGDWNNDTMDYNGVTGKYENASFTVDQTGGIYYYRIWSNDTNGNSGASDTQNITAEWDYTWTLNPTDFGTTDGYINSVGEIGILWVNNTGDDVINISFSDNWLLPVNYNGSESLTIYPTAKQNVTVNITAKFADTDNENQVIVTATAVHATETPNPTTNTSNFTLNTYSGGPYLYVTIVEYPTTTAQNLTNVTLAVKVKNGGNETATATWLNWTLPTGWYNVSGNLNKELGNIASGATQWNNITAGLLSSSASASIVTIRANGSCTEGKNASDSKLVLVGCNNDDGICGEDCNYQTDSDCESPSPTVVVTGGGGAAVSIASEADTKEGETGIIVMEETIEAARNETANVTIEVRNIYTNAVLNDLYITVSGFPEQYMSLSSSSISKLDVGESAYVNLYIEPPFYMEQTDYTLAVTADGQMKIGGLTTESFSETKEVRLLIRRMTEENAAEVLANAQQIVDFMLGEGLPTDAVVDVLAKMRKAMDEKNYGLLDDLSTEIERLRDESLGVMGLFDDVGAKLDESKKKGIMTPETKRLFYRAQFAFSRSDFFVAGDMLKSAQLIYVLETKGKINYVNYVQNNWVPMATSIAILSIVGLLMSDAVNVMFIGRRLGALNREEDSIIGNMRNTQEEFLEKGKMDSTEYHRRMYEYERELEKIKDMTTQLLTKASGLWWTQRRTCL